MTRIPIERLRKPPPASAEKRKPKGGLKRSRLPSRSKKRAKLMRKVGPKRKEFLESVGACMFEGCGLDACDPHEIACGHARADCLDEFELVMGLCRKHHKIVQHWPPAKQIAMRTLWKLKQVCRLYCELRGTAETHVTAEEVIGYLMFRKRPQK